MDSDCLCPFLRRVCFFGFILYTMTCRRVEAELWVRLCCLLCKFKLERGEHAGGGELQTN